jgi:sugar/nucleoside kinase (ribokinase family)
MALTVVGSIAFDAVKTPFGERERMLGGAATHFSLAASFFTEVRPVGPVGDDFGSEQFELLEARGIKTDDIERVAGGKSFFWRGHYDFDLNVAHTDDTQLGVFGEFEPKLSDAAQAADTLFLANIQPDLQRQVRSQCAAGFSGLDSMNLWIDIAKDSLLAAVAEVDCVVLNDAEIRMLTGESNLARAARAVMAIGPRAVVAKQGEYGAALFTDGGNFFALPGFPLEDVRDPTGAGDSFAGGFFGYLDGVDGDLDEANLRRAMGYGTVLASFNVEEFGTERVARLTGDEVSARVRELGRYTNFTDTPLALRG